MLGTVTYEDGRPAAGVTVSSGAHVTSTRADGTFTLDRDGGFVVVSRPTGYTASPWWHRVTTDDEEPNFVLVAVRQELPFEFLHLTDTHTTAPTVPSHGLYEAPLASALADFLRAVPQHSPHAQAVMITGDLVDLGMPDEFVDYKLALAESPVPVHVLPGNHDHMAGSIGSVVSRNNYLTNTGDVTEYEAHLGPRYYSLDVAGLHVVALDWHAHELGIDHETQNAWLRADLALLPHGAPWIMLVHDQPSASILDGLPWQPLATFSGHWHTSRVVDVDGTLHVNSPTTLFASLDYSPPAFRHVTWDGERITLRTQTVAGIDYDGPLAGIKTATFAPAASGDATTGAVVWQAATTGAALRQEVTVADGVVFTGLQIEDRAEGRVEAFALADGAAIWAARTRSAVKSAPAVADGVVVAAEVSGDVVGLDAADGRELWRTPSSDPLRRFAWGAPVVDGGRVFVGDPSDLRCLDARTGEVVWRRTDLSPHHNLLNHAAPLIIGDLLVVGMWPTPLDPVGLDTATGETRWVRPEADLTDAFLPKNARVSIRGTGAYDAERDAVVVPAYRATAALDRATGAQRWVTEHEAGYSSSVPVVTPAGYAAVVAGVGVRMLAPETGEVLWDLAVQGAAPFPMRSYESAPHPVIAPPVLVDGVLLLPGLDGIIRSISLDGRIVAETALPMPVAAPLVAAGDALVALGTNGAVTVLSRAGMAAAAAGLRAAGLRTAGRGA